MSWTVQAQYHIRPGGSPGPRRQEASWSSPVTWRFKVMERGPDRNLEVIRIRAEELSSTGRGSAGFIFLGERNRDGSLRSLSMARAAHRGGSRSGPPDSIDFTRLSSGPIPAINELSLAPSDFPMFDEPGPARLPELVSRFELTERQATMFFSRDLVQRVRPAALVPRDERLKLAVKPGRPVLEYTVTRPSDRSGFQQLWSPDFPWFLYSENGAMKAWLVDTR